MSCSTGRIAVPLYASFTPANAADNSQYCDLVNPFAGLFQYVLCDPEYDDHKLYEYTKKCRMRLVCPVRKFRLTTPARLKLVRFYRSKKGQRIYGDRKISIEPLFGTLKETFGINQSPVRGFEKS